MFTLLAWYGLGTWLPKLMQGEGTDLGSALTFALALNLGAVAGSFVTAWGAVRFGTIPTSIVAAAVAGGALLALLAGPPVALVYVIFVLAGVGTHGTQCLIIAAVASHYPDEVRGTALGWALGIGRIGAVSAPQIGGWLLAAGSGCRVELRIVRRLRAGRVAVAHRHLAPARRTGRNVPRPRTGALKPHSHKGSRRK